MRLSLGFFFVLLFCNNAHSAHIASANMSYSCLGNDEYEFEMIVYRDCFSSGAQFDQEIVVGVYNNQNFFDVLSVPMSNFSTVEIDSYEGCQIDTDLYCVEKTSYIFTLTLPQSEHSYTVHYSRCCWLNTIANIVEPGETGITVLSEISPAAQEVCNTLEPFNLILSNPICAGVPVEFSLPTIDSEGDSLAYTMCLPYKGGGITGSTGQGDPTSCEGVVPAPQNCPPTFEVIELLFPYTPENPFPTIDGIHIDNELGTLTFTPSIQGRFLFGLCIKEYRNGELLGSQTVNLSLWDILSTSVNDIDSKVEWKIIRQNENVLLVQNVNTSINKTNLKIFNSNGTNVYDAQDINSNENINISPLSLGLYFIHFYEKGTRTTLKFIKSK